VLGRISMYIFIIRALQTEKYSHNVLKIKDTYGNAAVSFCKAYSWTEIDHTLTKGLSFKDIGTFVYRQFFIYANK
jgi:hypothetical protein